MSHNANKRLACDRCRDQKLRCSRADQSSEPCVRCQRAGAQCVTGSARPLGRPRLPTQTSHAAHASHPAHSSISARSSYRTAPGSARRGRAARSPSAPSARMTSRSPSMPLWSLASGFPDFAGTTSTGSDTVSDGTSNRAVVAASLSLSTPYSSAEPWAQLGLDNLLDMSLFQESDLLCSSGSGVLGEMDGNRQTDRQRAIYETEDGAPHERQQHGLDRSDNSADAAASTLDAPLADVTISLARVSEKITRHLAQVHGYAWRSPAVQANCSAKLHSPTANPLAETLQSTAEFIAILRTLAATDPAVTSRPSTVRVSPPSTATTPSLSDSHSSPQLSLPAIQVPELDPVPRIEPTMETSSKTSPLHTPTALLLLANYLQLMRLYNIIFSRVCEALGDMSHDDVHLFQVQAGFLGAGMPTMQGPLYIKIVIQIIEHQMETMEQLLGLPAENRLSGRATAGGGIFSHADASTLAHTVIKEDVSGTADAGKSLAASLREKIDWVQKMLREGPEAVAAP